MATSTIKPKRGTTAQWEASGRVLEENEWGVEVTPNGHHILRIGDGEHLFHELPAVFDAENYETLMTQAVNATNTANTAAANADTARDNANSATAAALAAADTASIAAQANTNAVIVEGSGEVVAVNDSSNLALVGLKLFGKTTQDGTPTPDAPVPLVSVGAGGTINTTVAGKNLLDLDKARFNRCAKIDDGIVLAVNNSSYAELNLAYLVPVLRNGMTLTFSVKHGIDGKKINVVIQGERTNGSIRKEAYSEVSGRTASCTIDDFKTITGVSVRVGRSDEAYSDTTTIVEELQLELGDTATAYEPYTAQTITAQTPNGLPGIPVTSGGNYTDANGQQWVCDEIDFARGVYVKRVETVVLDGVSNGSCVNSTSGEAKYAVVNTLFLMRDYTSLSSHFAYGTSGNAGLTYNTDNRIRLFYKDNSLDTVDKWNAWLEAQYKNSTPVTALVGLATPIETALSAEEIAAFKALHSNKPNTTVYNDSGAGMSVEYIADTKIYIDNKFTELQNAILSAGANV